MGKAAIAALDYFESTEKTLQSGQILPSFGRRKANKLSVFRPTL